MQRCNDLTISTNVRKKKQGGQGHFIIVSVIMRTIGEYATKVIDLFRNKPSIKRQIFVSNIW